ncbi:MAG: haloacid dehalogenase [Candidatus Hodarchaeales archaeon]|jgi:translin
MEMEFERIRTALDIEDEKRELILKLGRRVIRYCSDSIKMLHRGELEKSKDCLNQARELFTQINAAKKDLDNTNVINSLQVTYQEYTEAWLFLNYLERRNLLSYDDEIFKKVEIPVHCYVLGICDFTGELSRNFLDVLRNKDIKKATDIFEFIQNIYHNLITLDYPGGLVPGMRRKVDVVRMILEKSRNTLTQAVIISNLPNLDK